METIDSSKYIAELDKNRSEHSIQSEFTTVLKLLEGRYPELRHGAFAIPNQRMNTAARAKFAREGAKGGIPDYFIMAIRGGYGGLMLEFKNAKGRLSPKQKEKIAYFKAASYRVEVVRSADEAVGIVEEYLDGYK